MRFELDPLFVESFAEKTVEFGPVGLLAFARTYSRPLDPADPSKGQERWKDTVARVVNGTYSFQKMHCTKNNRPWDENKAQRSAQEMYRRMFEMKFTPPGRGLWAMGTDFVYERGGAALNNCFSGDTRFFMRKPGHQKVSLVAFKDVLDSDDDTLTVDVLTDDERWRPAIVSCFGVQKLTKVSFAPRGLRSNFRLEYSVTANHEWILSSGERTTSLSVGDVVKIKPRLQPLSMVGGADGFSHGFVFGDGSCNTYNPKRHHVRLCGKKAAFKTDLERASTYRRTTTPNSYGGDPVVYFDTELEREWKQLPPDDFGWEYQREFVRGWLSADAYSSDTGTHKLTSQNKDAVDWLIERAPLLGYCIVGVNIDPVMETNFGRRKAPLYRLSLTHAEPTEYTVKGIEDEGRSERVYCVTEPKTSSFTLEGGLVTGNCAFVSTGDLQGGKFRTLSNCMCLIMDLLMHGVGVGADVRGAGHWHVRAPQRLIDAPHVVEDSREGWVEAVRILLDAYTDPHAALPSSWDLDQIRPAGSPIKSFGGTACGPEPLRELLGYIEGILEGVINRDGPSTLGTREIADIVNCIGVCVVAGGVRRSAEILLGDADDEVFLDLKSPANYDSRGKWMWASNNSVFADDIEDFGPFVDRMVAGGEPGLQWLELAQAFGRTSDAENFKDVNALGTNPCGEQTLFSRELCCLVETYIGRHKSLADFLSTLKYAYLYGKSVTLVDVHDESVNKVMMANRRIGTSIAGALPAYERFGQIEFVRWLRAGYDYIQQLDRTYSEWLDIPMSIKTTTVKPGGTTPLLPGECPGIHADHAAFYKRRVIVEETNPLVELYRSHGYPVEPSEYTPRSQVVTIPVRSSATKFKDDYSIEEQVRFNALIQRHWSDNQVSQTVNFKPEDATEITELIPKMVGHVKSLSFLPSNNTIYKQMPYEEISEDEYLGLMASITPVTEREALGDQITHGAEERFCDGDSCTMPVYDQK